MQMRKINLEMGYWAAFSHILPVRQIIFYSLHVDETDYINCSFRHNSNIYSCNHSLHIKIEKLNFKVRRE